MIVLWLLGLWIGVSLLVGGGWVLIVNHWRARRAAELAGSPPPARPAQREPATNLPGSAYPPGSETARAEPDSTPLKIVH